MRKILHIDINNFYASVECLENPTLKDGPVVVCGDVENRHGVVLAKNYIAKELGIKTGMVLWEAKTLAPNLTSISARFDVYTDYSKRVKEIYLNYTDLVEPYGIDECWLDVSGSTKLFGSAHHIAYTIKERIKNEIGLTVSVGISDNKIYAKLGSDIAGRDEIIEITNENKESLIYPLPVENILYVGRATKKKLNKLAIMTIGDLANANIKILKNHLGKWGEYLHSFANGSDLSQVRPINFLPHIKSIGNSLTNYKDIINDHDIMSLILILSESVIFRARESGIKHACGLSIWIKNSELETFSYSTTMPPTLLIADISTTAFNLFKSKYDYKLKVRALGISISNFVESGQLSLDYDSIEKKYSLENSIYKIKQKYGTKAINRGVIVRDERLKNIDIKSSHTIHPESYFKK